MAESRMHTPRAERRAKDRAKRRARNAELRAQAEQLVRERSPRLDARAFESAVQSTVALLRGNQGDDVARKALRGTAAKPGRAVRLPAVFAASRSLAYGDVRHIFVDDERVTGEPAAQPVRSPAQSTEVVVIRRRRAL